MAEHTINSLRSTHTAAPQRWEGETDSGENISIYVRGKLRVKIDGEVVYQNESFEDEVKIYPDLHEIAFELPNNLIDWHKDSLNNVDIQTINIRRHGYVPGYECRSLAQDIINNNISSSEECNERIDSIWDSIEEAGYDYPYEVDSAIVDWMESIASWYRTQEKVADEIDIEIEAYCELLFKYLDGEISSSSFENRLQEYQSEIYEVRKENNLVSEFLTSD